MTQRILRYLLSFVLLFSIGYYAHTAILTAAGENLDFSLLGIYGFHATFSFFICTLLFILSRFPRFGPQLGFLYLGGFMIKFVAFAIIFENLVVGEKILSAIDSVSLLVPIALFLGLEVYFVAKILRTMDAD